MKMRTPLNIRARAHWARERARDSLRAVDELEDDIHTMVDKINSQAAEIKRLQAALAECNSEVDAFLRYDDQRLAGELRTFTGKRHDAAP